MLLIERIYNSSKDIEPKHLVLVPAFIPVVHDIVHLQPDVEVLIDSEFRACIQVEGGFSF